MALLLPAFACETATRTSDVVEAAGRAEVAYAAMDDGALEETVAEARESLGCLGEPLTVDGAAAYHRAEALSAFFAGDAHLAGAHFTAARALLPGWQLPSAMAPPGHPLREVFDGVEPGTGTLPLILGGVVAWYQVDGLRREEVPAERPYVLQRFGSDGAVLDTRLTAGEPPTPEPLPVVLPEPRRRGHGLRVGLAVGAGALAALSAASFGNAGLRSDRYWDPTQTPSDLEPLRTATNGSMVAGAAFGVAAVGCATGAMLVGRF
ncbi:MAG: hypothetical protein JRI25_21195 [Deltaproteobacteria bacterium]|nr:hypothetical protein [Deltaproteobacteria bacterium]